jgi:hypothetical protein
LFRGVTDLITSAGAPFKSSSSLPQASEDDFL